MMVLLMRFSDFYSQAALCLRLLSPLIEVTMRATRYTTLFLFQ